MKQLIPFSLFLFISFQVFAQDVSVSPNPFTYNFAADLSSPYSEVVAHTEMTNNTTETLNVKWLIVPGEDCPDTWNYLVCDKNNCYTTAVASNQGGLVNNPVVLAPGESALLDLHLRPNHVSNCCLPKVEVMNYDDPSIKYTTAEFDVCIENATAVTERQKANLRVFPNPTANYISLSEQKFVKQLWVSNILGKRVKTFPVTANNTYDVSILPDGIYLVSMVGEDNKVLKTVRISKRSIRP